MSLVNKAIVGNRCIPDLSFAASHTRPAVRDGNFYNTDLLRHRSFFVSAIGLSGEWHNLRPRSKCSAGKHDNNASYFFHTGNGFGLTAVYADVCGKNGRWFTATPVGRNAAE